jgi:hypothetical protein
MRDLYSREQALGAGWSVSCAMTRNRVPEDCPLVGALPNEEDPPPDERGGVCWQAVDAGEALLLQQLILRHQAVLEEIGTVAVRPLQKG